MPPKTPNSTGTPIFSTSIFSSSNNAASRPTTRDGHAVDPLSTNKDRKTSFSRKASLSSRRGSSFGNGPNAYVTDAAAPPALPDYALSAAAKVTARPDIPGGEPTAHHPTPSTDSQMLSRSATGSTTLHGVPSTPMGIMPNGSVGTAGMWQQNEASIMHHHVTELANKRISTLEYLRKAYVAKSA